MRICNPAVREQWSSKGLACNVVYINCVLFIQIKICIMDLNSCLAVVFTGHINEPGFG